MAKKYNKPVAGSAKKCKASELMSSGLPGRGGSNHTSDGMGPIT